ncbi:MAG: family 10 glycosylhydrolase, partial [bacterium]
MLLSLFRAKRIHLMVVVACWISIAIGSANAQQAHGAAWIKAIWADTSGGTYTTKKKSEDLVASVKANGFDHLLLQVRSGGDAFYVSDTEPLNTGIARDYPDPLQDILSQAHKGETASERLSVHAWIVPFTVSSRLSLQKPSGTHVLARHPDWLNQDRDGKTVDSEGSQNLDPGVPEVQDYIVGVVAEIVRKYPVDGIHLDRLQYPEDGRNWGYNPKAVARFDEDLSRTGIPAPDDAQWVEWRRDQITALVRKIGETVKEIRPECIVSASVLASGPFPSSEEQFKESPTYSELFQNWLKWNQDGLLDWCVPTIFRNQTTQGA